MDAPKKDLLLIANYWHFEEEKASSRYRTMANMIVEKGYSLEVVTSSFRHLTKKQRNMEKTYVESLPYKVSMLYEPGYKKNISISRMYSHIIFGKKPVLTPERIQKATKALKAYQTELKRNKQESENN